MPMFPHSVTSVLIGLLSWLSVGQADQLQLPAIFSDHMVLQRDQAIQIWGKGAADDRVTVRFAGQERPARVRLDGSWQLLLDPLPASSHGRELIISSDMGEEVVFVDVLVGEVWLAAGQSNMEKPLGEKRGQKPTDNHLKEIANANFPLLRLFHMPHLGKVTKPESDMRWLPCSPETIDAIPFSAAGYFFGRELLLGLDVPVGIIHSSFGGSMIEAWSPRGAFLDNPLLAPLLDREYFAWVDDVQATDLFTSMIAPLVPYTLRGFIWYQGEANLMVGDAGVYYHKMNALISAWRRLWSASKAPFIYAQLAPFNYSTRDGLPNKLTPEALPRFWEVQASCSDIPNTGMIVTTDLAGNARDIHPTNKRDVGMRFANLALADVYGMPILADSPTFSSVAAHADSPGALLVVFNHYGKGLRTRDGLPPTHFQIADSNGVYHPAQAEITSGNSILLRSPDVPHPKFVRFAWDDTANPNLINSASLPAAPFRTDSRPIQLLATD